MATSRLVFLSLLFYLSSGQAQLYEGDACELENGARGVCRSAKGCPAASDEIAGGSLPQVCSFIGNAPIICCVEGSSSTKRPTTRQVPPTTTTTTRRPTTMARETTTPKSSTEQRVDETTVAGRKCREYARYVYWKKILPSLGVIPEYFNASECVHNVETLIVGGKEAEAKEFPHMAALGFGPENNIQWKCGGSLISERYIITVAHCLSARGSGPVSWARLGDLNINSAKDDMGRALTMKVVERIKHNDYKAPAHYNDMAILKLEADVTFSPFIRPACLYNRPGDPVNINNATAIGWGKIQYNQDVGSDQLMKVTLSLQDPSRCNDTFHESIKTGGRLRSGINPDSMVCAGDPMGKRDTCVGDSGGPLQIRLVEPDPVCMYSIIGLTSFGKDGCGIGDNPAVYTRVSNYIPWIEGIVWPEN